VTTDPRSTAELLDDAELLVDHSTSDRLDAIRAVAEKDGIWVEVNVHGALVDLRIEERAMHQAPHSLANQITELAAEATRTATAEGLALVYWAGGAALAAHLASYQADEPLTADRTTHAPEPSDSDTIEPTSWAVSSR
jgi:hypothetical protein